MKTLGNRIKFLRDELGLTQKEFAKKINISPQQILRYENNRIRPSLEIIISIAQLCHVTTDFIIYGDDKKMLEALNIHDKELIPIIRSLDRLDKNDRDKVKWMLNKSLNLNNDTE